MTRNTLNKEYLAWLIHFVYDDQFAKRNAYHSLLRHLHEIDFNYILEMDGNRAEDGMDLRYRFAYENNYPGSMVATYLDDHPCSVLEMMVALSIRCEEHIMEDDEIGDRTGQWFWNMIVNLGLGQMTDEKYNQNTVDRVIDRFLNRDYDRNGKGGLFTVEEKGIDMRTVDIWYQMNFYLDSQFLKGELS